MPNLTCKKCLRMHSYCGITGKGEVGFNIRQAGTLCHFTFSPHIAGDYPHLATCNECHGKFETIRHITNGICPSCMGEK